MIDLQLDLHTPAASGSSSVTPSQPVPTVRLFPSITEPQPNAAEATARQLIAYIEREAVRRAGEHVDGWRAVWANHEATPQQICEALGTEAAKFFAVASDNVRHLATVAATCGLQITDLLPAEVLQSPPIKINPDGTVTVQE